MPITNTQEVYEIRSISPSHINPSIMEGRNMIPSILGEDRAISIVRYPPVFLIAPLLTGDPGIPSTLHCSPGVVDGSPSPYRHYRWQADGVDILGAGGFDPEDAYFTTNNSYDAKEITCIVDAINILGTVTATSNGIVASVIEPIFAMSSDIYAMAGMAVDDSLSVFSDFITIVTGMWVDDVITTFNADSFAIQGMSLQDHVNVVYSDIYSIQNFVQDSVLATYDGNTAGSWTVISGTLESYSTLAPTGSTVLRPRNAGITKVKKTIAVPAPKYAVIDANSAMVSVEFYATNNRPLGAVFNSMEVYLEAIDGTTSAVTRLTFLGTIIPPAKGTSPSNVWTWFTHSAQPIPPNTRTINVVMEFADAGSGGNDCQVDDISVKLWVTA